MPHHDAFLVAEIIEEIALVDASAPNAEHIHTRFLYGTQQLHVSSVLYSGGKEVLRNVVRPFGEDLAAVEFEKERGADRILLPHQFDGPNAKTVILFIQTSIGSGQTYAG
ncbi:MAG: Uncharacterised protein [Flavobacteriia bacterium]|nr:MAG: Uncharacterised protein [Flavobacteriia bacterium]